MCNSGEYKISPYKGFPVGGRGSAGILCSPGILGQPPGMEQEEKEEEQVFKKYFI
jgi:hypothetical protein